MGKIREYRIPMPLTVEEYQLAQLYMTAKKSRMETQDQEGAGVEVLKNEPCNHPKFGKGTYTLKMYSIHGKLPGWLKMLIPEDKARLREESFNCFPYIQTTLTLEMFKKFKVTIESQHLKYTDEDNALNLGSKELKNREVEYIEIGGTLLPNTAPNEDPCRFKSIKTGRGPLKKNWTKNARPIMCCYKLVRASFDYFGLRRKVEDFVLDYERDLFLSSHRSIYLWIDEWYGLSAAQVREIEDSEFRAANVTTRASRLSEQGIESAPPPQGAAGGHDVVPDAAFQEHESSGEDSEDKGPRVGGRRRVASHASVALRGSNADADGGGGARRSAAPAQPATGDLDAYVQQRRAGAGSSNCSSGAGSLVADQDGLESSSGSCSSQGSDDELEEEEEAARARRVQAAPGAAPGAVKGKGGITGRLADLAVKQDEEDGGAPQFLRELSAALNRRGGDRWSNTCRLKPGIGRVSTAVPRPTKFKSVAGVALKAAQVEDERAASRAAPRVGGLAKKKQAGARAKGVKFAAPTREEPDWDDVDSDDEETSGEEPASEEEAGGGRLCTAQLFSSRSAWVALCQGQRDSKGRRRLVGSEQDDEEEDDEEEEEEVEGVRRRPRGEGGTAPTWGETISSLNWRTAQWKLKLEGDRVKRSVTRRGATTLEAVLVGAKNTVDGVRDLGDRIFGQGDREFPLYKGEDD